MENELKSKMWRIKCCLNAKDNKAHRIWSSHKTIFVPYSMILSFVNMVNKAEENTDLSIVKTRDGSQTLISQRFGQHYHSLHGAVQESRHVFIKNGLSELDQNRTLKILEMGLGTGLNALLCQQFRDAIGKPSSYFSYEAFPIPLSLSDELNYSELLGASSNEVLHQIHHCAWETNIDLALNFCFKKLQRNILDGIDETGFDLVIYDAFSPGSQPELWTEEIFSLLLSRMNIGGILSTYCSKSDVRKALIAVGFQVKKLPGPPGKREMLQAVKV